MIRIIDELLTALRRTKEESEYLGTIKVVAQHGEKIFDIGKVWMIKGHHLGKTEEIPTCILTESHHNALLSIDEVLTDVQSIKRLSSDKGSTLVVVGCGDFILDLNSIKIIELTHPITAKGTFPICALVTED